MLSSEMTILDALALFCWNSGMYPFFIAGRLARRRAWDGIWTYRLFYFQLPYYVLISRWLQKPPQRGNVVPCIAVS